MSSFDQLFAAAGSDAKYMNWDEDIMMEERRTKLWAHELEAAMFAAIGEPYEEPNESAKTATRMAVEIAIRAAKKAKKSKRKAKKAAKYAKMVADRWTYVNQFQDEADLVYEMFTPTVQKSSLKASSPAWYPWMV
tara:strand:+ start:135 stop:539 length:405 start_codon:yes stop_codon:yes gene_type:complete